jgi:translation initiation factor eIF-2B subunit beta
VLRQVISKARFSNFDQLVVIIRDAGRRLVEAQPKGVFFLSLDIE